jgi:hypothetical protein
MMTIEFSAAIWYWRGPAPFYFVTVPDELCASLRLASESVTYGWGMIPVNARAGSTQWKTSLFPKDGRYIVPLKDMVRKEEGLAEGDMVTLRLQVG